MQVSLKPHEKGCLLLITVTD